MIRGTARIPKLGSRFEKFKSKIGDCFERDSGLWRVLISAQKLQEFEGDRNPALSVVVTVPTQSLMSPDHAFSTLFGVMPILRL